jgi:hypothetical protein
MEPTVKTGTASKLLLTSEESARLWAKSGVTARVSDRSTTLEVVLLL